jgi:hypothetical protein
MVGDFQGDFTVTDEYSGTPGEGKFAQVVRYTYGGSCPPGMKVKNGSF